MFLLSNAERVSMERLCACMRCNKKLTDLSTISLFVVLCQANCLLKTKLRLWTHLQYCNMMNELDGHYLRPVICMQVSAALAGPWVLSAIEVPYAMRVQHSLLRQQYGRVLVSCTRGISPSPCCQSSLLGFLPTPDAASLKGVRATATYPIYQNVEPL